MEYLTKCKTHGALKLDETIKKSDKLAKKGFSYRCKACYVVYSTKCREKNKDKYNQTKREKKENQRIHFKINEKYYNDLYANKIKMED